ncbi:MAG: hypothetical protein AAFN70_21375, partial [Planctomycetota bacterium]
YMVLRYLDRLAELTLQRDGVPAVGGFEYDRNQKRVLSYGISAPMQGQDLSTMAAQTLMLSEKAEQLGLVMDDVTIGSWLDLYTDNKLNDSQQLGVLKEVSENNMSRTQLYDTLRKLLLADMLRRRENAGMQVVVKRQPLVTPTDLWRQFLKTNQQAIVTAYPISIDDFMDQTDEPGDAAIRAMYDKHKDDLPQKRAGQVGFRKPTTGKFEFVAAYIDTLIDDAVKDLKEEDIRAEYDRRVATGAFRNAQLPNLSIGDDEVPEVEMPKIELPEIEMPEAGTPNGEMPDDTKPAENSGDPTPADEKPSAEEPGTEVPETQPAEEPQAGGDKQSRLLTDASA